MAEYIRNIEGISHSVTRRKLVASGVTVSDGDFVYQSGNTWTNAAIAGKRLDGTVTGGDTATLNRVYGGTTTLGDGTREVLVNIEKDAEYLVKVAGTGVGSFAAADEGSYFNLAQGTGAAQTVDYATKSATVGQLKLVRFNPGIRGTDATFGLFVIAFSNRVASASA